MAAAAAAAAAGHQQGQGEMTEAALQMLIQRKREKIQELQRSVELSQEAADREMIESDLAFSALMESVGRSMAQLMDTITEKHRQTEERAKGLIRELKDEITVLELSDRSSLSLNNVSSARDWTRVSVPPPLYSRTVVRAWIELEEELSDQMRQWRLRLEAEEEVQMLDLQTARRYAEDVTLDPVTAHPRLILSGDGKTVQSGNEWQEHVGYPERFNHSLNVLAEQGFTESFYFEVQVKNKTDWTLGVARESMTRRGAVSVCPSRGCWAIRLRNGSDFHACARRDCNIDHNGLDLSQKRRPEKVGVFVDYEQRLVSFYDARSGDLIYSFTGCSFSAAPLHPFFSPGPCKDGNSAPMAIVPVRQ